MYKEKLKEFFKDKYNLLLIGIVLFALIIRLKYLFMESLWNDETFYLWYVEHFFDNPISVFQDRVLSASYLFVFFLIALIRTVVWDVVLAGRIAVILLTLATIILTYFIGKELRDKTTGIIAALLLSVNPIYWLISNKVLLDVPLAFSFAFTVYSLIKFEKTRTKLWALILAISIFLTVNTKFSAYLVFPMLATYFFLQYILEPLIQKHIPTKEIKEFFQNKNLRKSILYSILLFAPLTIVYLIKYNSIIPRANTGAMTIATSMAQTVSTYNNYSLTFKSLPFLLTQYTLVLFLIGLFFCIVYRKKVHYILISYLITFQIYITLLLGGITEQRHILPALPGFLVLSALAITELKYFIEKLMNKKIHDLIIISIVIIFICYPLYNQGYSLNEGKSQAYIGYKEAGIWLKENVDPKTSYVMAGAPGFIRLYSNFEFVDDEGIAGRPGEGTKDGVLYYGLRPTKQEFESGLKELQKRRPNIYLETDIWEAGNQGWAYPLTQEKLDYIQSLGFKPVHVIEKELGSQKMPMVVIFKKE